VKRLAGSQRWALRTLASVMGGRTGANRLLVLHYHRVAPVADELFPDDLCPERFDQHLQLLQDAYRPLPLTEALERLERRSLPARAVCITFDDGYADNHDIALPILQRRGIAATFYIATGFMRGANMFNDVVIESLRNASGSIDLAALDLGRYVIDTVASHRAAIDAVITQVKHAAVTRRAELVDEIRRRYPPATERSLMMSETQIKALHAAGMEIGAHTVSHPILLRLDPTASQREIVQSRADLEAIVAPPVTSFAYPNGRPGFDYEALHVAQARTAGFKYALTTSWGCIHADSDRWQLPRVAPWDRTSVRFAARLALTYRDTQPAVAS